jgi:hypothetical protein
MEYKPWLNLNIDHRNFYMELKTKPIQNSSDIICYLIIQDCNQCGHYYRIIMWDKDKEFIDYTILYDTTWTFDKLLKNMKEQDIVTELNSKLQYKVLDSYNSEFIKILELI